MVTALILLVMIAVWFYTRLGTIMALLIAILAIWAANTYIPDPARSVVTLSRE